MSIGIGFLQAGDELFQPGSFDCFGFARHAASVTKAYLEPAAGAFVGFGAGAAAGVSKAAGACAAGLLDCRCKTRSLFIASGSRLSSLPKNQSNASARM